MFVESSGYVIVTDPSSPTVTSVASGLVFLTSSSTFAFSSSVKAVWSSTSVFSGATAGFFSASVFAFSVTVWSGVKVFVESSGYVIVTDPSSPTVTSVASGLESFTFSSTSDFSSFVRFDASSTSVFSGATAGFFSAMVSSELLSSFPASCPSTGTTMVCSPSARSSSLIVTVIGPSTSFPGVRTTLPLLSIVAGIVLPSSSVAVTVVVLSEFLTTMPVSCSSSVGLTGVVLPVI